MLNRVSSFFSNNTTTEKKLEPNLNAQKDIFQKKESTEVNNNSDFVLHETKLENDKTEKLHFDLDQNIKKIDDESKSFDLFTHQNQSIAENHQIDLTEIEQEDRANR